MGNGDQESLPDRAPSRIDIVFPAVAQEVRRARLALADLGLPDEVLEDARLMVSELVSNSIVHSGLGPKDEIRVQADWSGDTLRASVSDGPRDSEHVVIVGSIRPDPGSESGWGLFLVNELADRWGTDIDQVISYWFEIQVKPNRPG